MATKEQRAAFGQAIKRAREQLDMSIRDLAAEVEASHTVVWQWEQGEHTPRPPRIKLLEHVLQLPEGSLTRLLGYLPAGDFIDSVNISVIEAVQADSRLSDRDRRVLAAVYRELVRGHGEDKEH